MAKTPQIKLTKYEENNIIFWDDAPGFESGNRYFTIGHLPPRSRFHRLLGKGDEFVVLHMDTKSNYKVYRKTHDIRRAKFTLNNVLYIDMWMSDMRKLNGHNSRKENVMDLKVTSIDHDKHLQSVLSELSIWSNIEAEPQLIDGLSAGEVSNYVKLETKRSIAKEEKARKNKRRSHKVDVVIIPEYMPEADFDWM